MGMTVHGLNLQVHSFIQVTNVTCLYGLHSVKCNQNIIAWLIVDSVQYYISKII